jgi:hypothetical protein
MSRHAALLACALAAACCVAAAHKEMLAGDVLQDRAKLVFDAPLWRLDRVFYRTCVNVTCDGGIVRARAGRSCAGGLSLAAMR